MSPDGPRPPTGHRAGADLDIGDAIELHLISIAHPEFRDELSQARLG